MVYLMISHVPLVEPTTLQCCLDQVVLDTCTARERDNHELYCALKLT